MAAAKWDPKKPPSRPNGLPIVIVIVLVLVIGARDQKNPPEEGKDYTWYISGIFPANWVIICYLPPFTFEPEKTLDIGRIGNGT